MKHFRQITLEIVVVFVISASVAEIPLPCNVVWVATFNGMPVPENAIPSFKNEEFVGKDILTGKVGRVLTNGNFTTYIKPSSVASYYYVLTNPFDCAVSWVETGFNGVNEPRFAVWSGRGYVGRVSEKDKQLVGSIENNFMYATDIFEKKYPAAASKTLRVTKNLRMELSNFQFSEILQEETDNQDFLGLDLIVNEAAVSVTQTLVHKRTIKNSYSFTESNSFSSVTTLDISIGIPLGEFGKIGVDINIEDVNYNKDTKGIGHQEEKEVISSRTIIVPPYTSVQACSTVRLASDTPLPYTAVAKYTLFGMTASQVRNVLVEFDIAKEEDMIRNEGQSVLVKARGLLSSPIPMATNFIVMPRDDPDGCKELSAKISEMRRIRKFGKSSTNATTQRINVLKHEIECIVSGNCLNNN